MARTAIALQAPAGRSLQLSGELLVNLYAEKAPPGARVEIVLHGAPGLKPFASGMGSGPIRAVREALGYVWVLSSGTVYRVDLDTGTPTAALGLTVDQSGPAMMTDDGQSLTIQANISAYNVTAGAATQTLTLSGVAVNGETVTIGSTVYTWRTAITAAANDVLLTGVASTDIDNLISAINRTGAAGTAYSEATTAHATVSAAAGAGDTMVITARASGTDGNAVPVSETMTNGSWGGTTLAGGSDWTVAAITDPDFQGASAVDTLDSYTIFTKPDSGQWYISDLLAATTLDALDFATAEGSPDKLRRVFVDHREAIAFGEKTIEVYAHTGGADFPFSRIDGAFIERGCIAPASVAKMDNSVFWIADDRMVYRMQGYTPARISTPEVEEVLREAADIADAEGWTYTLAGHHVYVFTLPTSGITLCYDAQTGFWHQRRSGTAETGRWRAQWGCLTSTGKMLVGDSEGGNLFELDLDTYDENGSARRWVARTPGLYAEGARASMDLLELECELGVGLSSGQGSAPVVMLRTSDDGGKTWSPERQASVGALGDATKRALWRRNGSYRHRIIEISGSDPVKTTLFGLRHVSRMGVAA